MLYVADTGNYLLRRVDLRRRVVETIAGTGAIAREFNVPGVGRALPLNSPWGLHRHGPYLSIAMAGMHQLWRMDLASDYLEPFSGSGREDLIDAVHSEAALGQPSGLSGDDRHLYVADSEVNAVRAASLNPYGRIETLAGGGLFTFSLISQIEHGKTSPSLDTLRRIAKALRVPLIYLLLEDDLEPQVVRKRERHVVHLEDSQLRASFLSPVPPQHLELVLLELPPGKVAWTKPRSHEGQECRLVLKGMIQAYYGEKTYLLEEGDSILWNGTVPHRIENVGDGDAQLLIALAPPGYLPMEHSEEVDTGGTAQ
jgi:transcriptional regulator with XRE-family HTH domain